MRDAYAVVLDSGRFFSGSNLPSSLPVTSVASVLAHALGVADTIGEMTPEAQQMMQGGASQVAKKMPKAQVIFNVESVGKSTSTPAGAPSHACTRSAGG